MGDRDLSGLAGPASRELFARASTLLPGGVDSPVRAFRAVGGTPWFVDHGEGAYITDVDGRRFIDYVQSWGASILGHAHPVVIAAIREAAGRGTTFGAPTAAEVELAERVTSAVPGCEMVRFVSSGTEATMTAVRLARGVTGRERIVKFAGCYHGHADSLLAGGGSGVATLGLPDSAGVPRAAVADTIVVPYNTIPELDERVACVIVEPVAANMGLIAPEPGFLEGLRRACDEVGALLIFDEVITGFRLGRDGASGRFAIAPDLWCFGKVVGGGLPLAGLGASRTIMEFLAPVGPVYQAGTLSGNPLATAAGIAALDLLSVEGYAALEASVATLADGFRGVFADAGIAAQVPVVGTILGLYFAHAPVRDFDGAKGAAANGRYVRFFRSMLERGVSLAPSPYEVMFASLAHGEGEITRTLVAAAGAARELAAD